MIPLGLQHSMRLSPLGARVGEFSQPREGDVLMSKARQANAERIRINTTQGRFIHIVIWSVSAAFLAWTSFRSVEWFLMKTSKGDDPFLIGDWLINFEGGFVRRGLVGQLIVATNLGVETTTALIQVLMISSSVLLLVACLWMLWLSKPILPWAIVILSPAFLLFPFLSFSGAYRKELLALSALSLMALGVRKSARSLVWIGLIIFALSSVTHEALILALPSVIWLVFLARSRLIITRREATSAVGLVALAAMWTGATVVAGSQAYDQSADICASVVDQGFSPHTCSGSIAFLADSPALAIERVQLLLPDAWPHPILLVLALVPLLLVGFVTLYWRLALVQVLAIVPLYAIGTDYGRWIYFAVGLLSICALAVSDRLSPVGGPIVWGIVAFGMLFWSVPNESTQFFLNPLRLAWWQLLN